jgi:hypothetical protein
VTVISDEMGTAFSGDVEDNESYVVQKDAKEREMNATKT